VMSGNSSACAAVGTPPSYRARPTRHQPRRRNAFVHRQSASVVAATLDAEAQRMAMSN